MEPIYNEAGERARAAWILRLVSAMRGEYLSAAEWRDLKYGPEYEKLCCLDLFGWAVRMAREGKLGQLDLMAKKLERIALERQGECDTMPSSLVQVRTWKKF